MLTSNQLGELEEHNDAQKYLEITCIERIISMNVDQASLPDASDAFPSEPSPTLSPAPRRISKEVEREIRKHVGGLANAVAILAAIACFTVGVILFSGIWTSHTLSKPLGVGVLITGMVVVQLNEKRKSKKAQDLKEFLSKGNYVSAKLETIYDKSKNGYRPSREFIDELQVFYRGNSGRSILGQFASDWPARVKIDRKLIDIKINLGDFIDKVNPTEDIRLLILGVGKNTRLLAIGQLHWLSIDQAGQFSTSLPAFKPQGADKDADSSESQSTSLAPSFFSSVLVVLPTYALATWGVMSGSNAEFTSNGDSIPSGVDFLVTLLFTLTHGVTPVFFYRIFFIGIDAARTREQGLNQGLRIANLFTTLHMALWYGLPAILLAAMTSWYSLGWFVFHLIIAGKKRRRWTFIEHGSTSVALLLFLLMFSETNLFPLGIMVVIFQSLLLTLAEWKGRRLWVD